ncbi:MAG: preprotein translocase subunit YajC [Planctomycetota bacterium]
MQILGDPFMLIIISGILFILLVLRPQQKQMKQLQESLANLKKNDRVKTTGGVYGTVVQANADESTVILRIDENTGTRITIDRDKIAGIVVEEEKEKTS